MSSADNEVCCRKCGFPEAVTCDSSNGYTTTTCGQCGYWHELDHSTGEEESRGGFGSFLLFYNDGLRVGGGLGQAVPVAKLRNVFRSELRALPIKRIEVCLLLGGVWKTLVLKDFPVPHPKVLKAGRQEQPRLVTKANAPRPAPTLEEYAESMPF